MRIKCIACEVLLREIGLAVADSPHTVDLVFTPKDAHDYSDQLRDAVQREIDAIEEDPAAFDAVVLGYGLCGNGLVGIEARSLPLVLPRAHDCCTLFLGSKMKFEEHFRANPSQPFSAAGYLERSDSVFHVDGQVGDSARQWEQLVEQYGEDNARYVWETLHPNYGSHQDRVVFIDIPETTPRQALEACRMQAEKEQKKFQVLMGSPRLLRALLHGQWDEEEFLYVEPGQRIDGVYDWSEIVRAVGDTEY